MFARAERSRVEWFVSVTLNTAGWMSVVCGSTLTPDELRALGIDPEAADCLTYTVDEGTGRIEVEPGFRGISPNLGVQQPLRRRSFKRGRGKYFVYKVSCCE